MATQIYQSRLEILPYTKINHGKMHKYFLKRQNLAKSGHTAYTKAHLRLRELDSQNNIRHFIDFCLSLMSMS